jgi:C4-dicarboxylate-specific signal transduction histidine kinase
MRAGAVSWPSELARLRHKACLDEVASTLRHTALNDFAGVGALVYRLRRRVEAATPGPDPEVVAALEAIEARIAAAPARLNARFMPAVERTARTEVGPALGELVAVLGANVSLDAGPGGWAAIDRHELAVAVACLVENAAEAVAAAGRGTITVTSSTDHGTLAIEIGDDAEAIDALLAERLFDPFFSTRLGHQGLGLKIARAIAHRWDGELLLTPRRPAGLSARLELPAAPAPQPAASG